MNTPQHPDPSLSPDEYGQSRAAQRDRVIAELRLMIERVPEQTEFTNSRRYKLWGPIMLLVSLGMLAMAINMGRTGLTVCAGFLVVFSLLVTWQHRDAGKQVFMRLTRRQLFVDTLDAPIEMAEVQDILVKDEGLLTLQKLTLDSHAHLPTHHVARLQVFGNQAMSLNKPEPHVRIHSAGLMTGGRKLDCDEIAALLGAYRDAACAQQQLDALQVHG